MSIKEVLIGLGLTAGAIAVSNISHEVLERNQVPVSTKEIKVSNTQVVSTIALRSAAWAGVGVAFFVGIMGSVVTATKILNLTLDSK